MQTSSSSFLPAEACRAEAFSTFTLPLPCLYLSLFLLQTAKSNLMSVPGSFPAQAAQLPSSLAFPNPAPNLPWVPGSSPTQADQLPSGLAFQDRAPNLPRAPGFQSC